MSRVTEIGLFQSQEGLYSGKSFSENGLLIEGEFINRGEGKYDLTFSGELGTTYKGDNYEFFTGPEKDDKRFFKRRYGKTELVGEGKIINGTFNGKGKCKDLGEDMNIYYEGNFINGSLNGYGKKTIVYKYGDGLYSKETYKGEFKNGRLCGKGVLRIKDEYLLGQYEQNRKVEGIFEGDFLKGYGKITDLEDGTIYVGEVEFNFPNGKGKITYTNGDSFEGIFKDGILRTCYNLFTANVRGPIGWEMPGKIYDDFEFSYA